MADPLFRLLGDLLREHRRAAAGLTAIGLVWAAWDAAVPALNGYVLSLLIARHPLDRVLGTFGMVALLGWVPHANLLPLLLERYNLRRFRVPLLRTVTMRVVSRAAAFPPCEEKQPVVRAAVENLERFIELAVRSVPQMLRALVMLAAVSVISWRVTPLFLLCGTVAVGAGVMQYRRLGPLYDERQRFENRQRALENRVCRLHPADAATLLGRYRAALDARLDADVRAGLRDLGYRFWRDLLFNAILAGAALWGIYLVAVIGYDPALLTVILSYGLTANGLLASLVGLQIELVRIQASVKNLENLAPAAPGRDTTDERPPS